MDKEDKQSIEEQNEGQPASANQENPPGVGSAEQSGEEVGGEPITDETDAARAQRTQTTKVGDEDTRDVTTGPTSEPGVANKDMKPESGEEH